MDYCTIGIEPLKTKHNVIKLDFIITRLFIFFHWHWFEDSTYISYIVYDLDVLKVVRMIQIIGSLLVDKLFIASSWI